MKFEQVQAQYCPAPDSSSSSIVPTEPPTEEPAPTDAPTDPAPLKPYLTGNFTTCDNLARYVNFTIAEDAPAYDPATFKVLFNDQVAKCAPASNNPKILSCSYPPAPYGPPAYIQVLIGEELVNDFKFDGGSICDPEQVPDASGTEDPNSGTGPAATEPPTDESTD
ncbi:MAG: hypothetical protein HYU84_18345 [Chloroflexi bacterium]|nr:hypothetical protein [Chloroflexota bacterium]MBI3168685.1 hypothetical protein [Chloroflexota bacterium]